jgi:hypothetical protein
MGGNVRGTCASQCNIAVFGRYFRSYTSASNAAAASGNPFTLANSASLLYGMEWSTKEQLSSVIDKQHKNLKVQVNMNYLICQMQHVHNFVMLQVASYICSAQWFVSHQVCRTSCCQLVCLACTEGLHRLLLQLHITHIGLDAAHNICRGGCEALSFLCAPCKFLAGQECSRLEHE